MRIFSIFILLLASSVCFSQDASIASSNSAYKTAGEGWSELKNSARCAWDFTRMGKHIYETKDTVLDFTGHGYNAFRSGTTFNPVVMETMASGFNSITAAACENSNSTKKCYVQDGACTNLFNSNFEIHITLSFQDGQIGNQYFFGIENGPTKQIFLYVNSTGKIRFGLNVLGTTLSEWESSYIFPNHITGAHYVRVKCDFTGDVLKMYIDGIETTLTLSSGDAFNLIDNSFFNSSIGIAIGGVRAGSTSIKSGNGNMLVYKGAVTPILTESQALKIANWFTYLK